MSARLVRTIIVVVLALASLYLSFELGRLQSGYSVVDARRQMAGYESALAESNRRIDELERQAAILETSRDIDQETYSSVEDNLGELQVLIQEQEEEIAFYRGIVSPGDGVAGLRIQNVEVVAGEGEATHMLRVLLVQAIVHNDRVTGSVRATLRGTRDGESAELGLDALGTDSRATDIPYGFRYFQTLETGLSLPEGFTPAELEIQVWPGSPRGETIVQSFPWAEVAR
jgi:cell division protein FtsB